MSNESRESNNTKLRETQRLSPAKRFFLEPYSSAVVAIALLFLVFSVFTDSFLSRYNLFNLSRTAAIYAFIAAAQLMVAVIGGAPEPGIHCQQRPGGSDADAQDLPRRPERERLPG